MICAYCLLRIAREEAEAGLAETTLTLLPWDRHAAVTVLGGDALCLSHWGEHVSNVVEAAELAALVTSGELDPVGAARLAVLCAPATPGHRESLALLHR